MSESPEIDVYASVDASSAPKALYVHVPFCLHRCGYCDFTLVARKDDLIPAYLAALENELSRVDRQYEVDTIFIGGGTPTHLSAIQLSTLLRLIQQKFKLSPDGEFSIEANPDGLDDSRLSVLAEHGVNRLSLGVQSFDVGVLRTLERQHSPREAIDVIDRAAKRIDRVSLDLIFGVPGQTLECWKETLNTATGLPVSHVSTYGLTFEKGTDFFSRVQKGTMTVVPDELERSMYAAAMEHLPEASYEQYEISNFGKPGEQCRHNLTYWAADPYFAFGPGGARYVNGIRSTNARNVTRWIDSWIDGKQALQDWEELSSEARTREAIFLGLRKTSGINLSAFESRFHVSATDVDSEATETHINNGWLELTTDHMRLTKEGRFMADSVISDFL